MPHQEPRLPVTELSEVIDSIRRMGKSSAHRKLSTQLEGWDVGRIATLLQRRPDLATPHPPANIAELAQRAQRLPRSEEHTSELQSLMRISYAVFCLQKKNNHKQTYDT